MSKRKKNANNKENLGSILFGNCEKAVQRKIIEKLFTWFSNKTIL